MLLLNNDYFGGCGPVIHSNCSVWIRMTGGVGAGGGPLLPDYAGIPFSRTDPFQILFSLRGAETDGEVGCWSVPLEAFVRGCASWQNPGLYGLVVVHQLPVIFAR